MAREPHAAQADHYAATAYSGIDRQRTHAGRVAGIAL
jgi:hypothetical protein